MTLANNLGFLSFLFFSIISFPTLAQKKVQINGFGHIESHFEYLNDEGDANGYFSLGEQDLFINAVIKKRLSFLGETVVKFDAESGSTFAPSIERARLKYEYRNHHSILFGKMHTPVNYWNDVYHHGRLFFPTIDRPLMFSHFLPIHTLGLRAQGQNIGSTNFGYDVQIGNGIESSDVFDTGMNYSFLAAVHIKPQYGTRIGASYYYDHLSSNSYGVHAHSHGSNNLSYRGPVDFQMFAFSIARFEKKLEILSESAVNLTRTDSLGHATSFGTYLYMGYNYKEKHTPYVMADFLHIGERDLHSNRVSKMVFSIGYKYEFDAFANIKIQLEQGLASPWEDHHNGDDHSYSHHHLHTPSRTALKIQFSYGI